MASRGAYAFWSPDVHDAVAHDAVDGDVGCAEAFTREGLDRIAPRCADGEGHVGVIYSGKVLDQVTLVGADEPAMGVVELAGLGE